MTRQQPAEVRRRRILDAAASLLVRQGLHGTSMDDVAAGAQVAKGTVYIYFPSRSELLAALRHRYAEEVANRARSVLRSDRPWKPASVTAAAQRLVAELTDYLLSNRRLHHVLFQEAGVSEEETLEPLRDLLREMLQQAMDDGALRATDPDVLMRFLLDGLHGAMLPLFHRPRTDRERVLAALKELVRRVLPPAVSN